MITGKKHGEQRKLCPEVPTPTLPRSTVPRRYVGVIGTFGRMGRRGGSRDKGFTLLEVIIALLILAIGLTSIFSLLGRGTHSLYQGVTDLTLTSYATTIFSELSAKLKDISDPPQNLYKQQHPSFPSNFTYDLEFISLDPVNPFVRDAGKNAILVVLTIKWMRGRYDQSEKFQYVILR